MKKLLCIVLFSSAALIGAQGKRFYEKGKAAFKQPTEKINLRFEHNLPFVRITIGSKSYNFLFDSGAPTVISQEIFRDLNLKKKYSKMVGDSNKKNQEQVFTELPEMTIDHVVFRNTGAIVLDLKADELRCLRVDGIIGANQMAGLVWNVNYAENRLEVAKDLAEFDLRGFDLVVPFETRAQKTPVVKIRLLDKDIPFTFDTGFSGRLELADSRFDPEKVKHLVKTSGTRSTGAFGTAKPAGGYIFRASEMKLGNQTFYREIASTGNMNLIGNEFFRDFNFIIDWKSRRIYMKQIRSASAKLESFGFSYRFSGSGAVVAFVMDEERFPLKNGDTILSINGISLDRLNENQTCHYFINRIEKDQQVINVKIDRKGEILDFQLEKKEYLN